MINDDDARTDLLFDLADALYPHRGTGLTQSFWRNVKVAGKVFLSLAKNFRDLPGALSFVGQIAPYKGRLYLRNRNLQVGEIVPGYWKKNKNGKIKEPVPLIVESLPRMERIAAHMLKTRGPEAIHFAPVPMNNDEYLLAIDVDDKQDLKDARRLFEKMSELPKKEYLPRKVI